MIPTSTHLLIIGGTGMLREASCSLVGQAQHATLVARDPDRLQQVAAGGEAGVVSLDYHRTGELIERLCVERAAHGPFNLTLLWMHSSADESFERVVDLLAEQKSGCAVFDVRGSASAAPDRGADARQTYAGTRVDYHRVVLGYVREDEQSRWLTHTEISEGVRTAVETKASKYIVGTVRPWDERP